MNKTTVAQQTKPVRHLRSAESTSVLSGRVSSRPFFGPTFQMKPNCACGRGLSALHVQNRIDQCDDGTGAKPRGSTAHLRSCEPLAAGQAHHWREQRPAGTGSGPGCGSGHGSAGTSAVSVAPLRIQRYTVQATWQVGGTHARRRGPAGLLWHRATSAEVIHAL